MALPVHAARRARLGCDPSAGARRAAHRREAAQGRDVREPQRLLLHDRSGHREIDCRQAVCRDDVGQGDQQPHRPARSCCRTIIRTSRARSTCPDLGGGTNFMSPSYDPASRLFFVTARETCATYFAFDQEFKVGIQWMAGGTVRPRDQKNWGALRAIDPITAERKWEFRYPTTSASGVLSTASGLVFAGDGDGNLMAFESKTGKNLWHYQMGSALRNTSGTTLHAGRPAVFVGPRGDHAHRVCVARDPIKAFSVQLTALGKSVDPRCETRQRKSRARRRCHR